MVIIVALLINPKLDESHPPFKHKYAIFFIISLFQYFIKSEVLKKLQCITDNIHKHRQPKTFAYSGTNMCYIQFQIQNTHAHIKTLQKVH